MKKRFSMQNKLVIIFGLLAAFSAIIEGFLAVQTARKAVVEKVTTHLIDKAEDTAVVLDGRITAFIQFLEGIARMPMLSDASMSNTDKVLLLQKEAGFSSDIIELNFSDLNGTVYSIDGDAHIGDREWFQTARSGKPFISEPINSATTQKLIQVISLPVYDNNRQIIGVLSADIDGLWLSNQINDIVIAQTGNCYIMSNTGVIIADKDTDLVKNQSNIIEQAKTNIALTSSAVFLKHVLDTDKRDIGYYTYQGTAYISSFSAMKTANWNVIIRAPVNEFMGTVDELRNQMFIIGAVILAIALAVTFFVARAMVKPIAVVVTALKDIAQGEGDLTV
ncbi:MAG: cache domain-containing protein, partial [Treponema sp.]